MKKHIISFLRFLLSHLLKSEWEIELKRRVDIVGNVLYKNAGELINYGRRDGEEQPIHVVEGASFNYFSFKDSTIPRFDFVLSNTPLYIIIGTPFNSSKKTALDYGCSETDWEDNLNKLEIIKTALPKLEQINLPAAAKFLFFDWDEPVSEDIVYLKLIEKLVDQKI